MLNSQECCFLPEKQTPFPTIFLLMGLLEGILREMYQGVSFSPFKKQQSYGLTLTLSYTVSPVKGTRSSSTQHRMKLCIKLSIIFSVSYNCFRPETLFKQNIGIKANNTEGVISWGFRVHRPWLQAKNYFMQLQDTTASLLCYMSGFDRRVKTDIPQWHTTKYASILPVGCLMVQK